MKKKPLPLTFPFIVLLVFFTPALPAQSSTDSISNILQRKDCSCTSAKTKNARRYAPPISHFYDYKKWQDYTDWTFKNGEEDFNRILMPHQYTKIYELYSSRPIVLVPPARTFALNFTPCHSPKNYYYLEIYLSVKTIRGYEDFDHSARSYFRFFYHPEKVRDFLVSEIQYRPMPEVNRALGSIRQRYGLPFQKLSSLSEEGERAEDVIDSLLMALEAKNIWPDRVALEEFILTDTAFHPINAVEFERLQKMFWEISNSSLDKVTAKYVHPDYYLSAKSQLVGVEISSAILKPSATADTTGITTILMEFEHNWISYKNGMGYNPHIPMLKSTCLPPSEIAETGIGISFKKAEILALSYLRLSGGHRREDLNYSHYPLFSKMENDKPVYDSLLTQFSGLHVPEAIFEIPFKGQVLKVQGSNVLINNWLVAGKLDIRCEFSEGEVLTIPIGETSVPTSVKELESYFLSRGFDQISLVPKENALEVHFKKLFPHP